MPLDNGSSFEERYGDVPFASVPTWGAEKKALPGFRRLLTVCLCACAAATMVAYRACAFLSCSALHGSVFGVPLDVVGIVFAAFIGVLSFLSSRLLYEKLLPVLLSLFAGAEVFLIKYQVEHVLFCPFCLAYGMVMLFALAVNLRKALLIWVPMLSAVGYLFMKFFCVIEIAWRFQ